MMTFLLVVHGLLALALVGVILMQKSEGGGLTSSGAAGGLVSARGAADLLTRATSILAALFIITSLVLAMMATSRNKGSIDTSLARPAAEQPVGPLGAPNPAAVPAAATPAQPAPATAPAAADEVPLAK